MLLIDDEVQLLIGFRHHALVVLQVEALGLEQLLAHAFFTQEFDERLGFWQTAVGSEQCKATRAHRLFVCIRGSQLLLGLGDHAIDRLALLLNQLHHLGLELIEFMLVAFWCRARNNQWGPRFVNQHAVHLVHNRVVVLALHQLIRTHRHVVTEVIKAKLVVGAVHDVALVGVASRFGVGLMPVDAIDAEAVELENGAHPFRVTSSQIVVDRHEVNAAASERIEKHGEGRHQSLSFTRLHLGHLAAVQCNASNELHIVVHHVPFNGGTRSHPFPGPERTVSVDADKIAFSGQIAVVVLGTDFNLAIGRETASGLLEQGKSLRHQGLQHLLDARIDLLFQRVHPIVQDLLGLKRHGGVGGRLRTQFFCLCHQGLHVSENTRLQVSTACPQLIGRQTLHLGFKTVDGINRRLNVFDIRCRLVADQALDDFIEGSNHGCCLCHHTP